uniref:(California timema) hypothetical protein n=1 Tax=Timema californicum TaxID=61474 RepID=A0A7R9P3Z9_TIMCA|nr:unnamed protein product [Timema californicum]
MLATFLVLFNVLRLLLTKYKNYNSEDIDRARRSVRMALLLLPLLVINDVFLLARTSKPKELWQLKMGTYTFRLIRGCQGIFMALIYCLLRREVLEGGRQMICYYIASRRYERARHDDNQLCETEDQTQAPSEAPSNTINLKETVTRWFKH